MKHETVLQQQNIYNETLNSITTTQTYIMKH